VIESNKQQSKNLVESYHILYHIGMLRQDHQEALMYSAKLHKLLSESKKPEHLLERVCVSSMLGFQYIKFS